MVLMLSARSRGLAAVALTLAATLTATGLAAAADTPAEGKVAVQWFGQSAFKITSPGGKVILIDPFITQNPKTPPEHKDLGALGRVDLVLVTHAHGDHVGDGPVLAKSHQAPLYGPAGLNDTLVALGELPKELSPRFNKGGTIAPLGEGIRITMTRAEHSSEYRWNNPETGRQEIHVGGEPAGFVIELENGFRIYHMGDTGLFGDLRLIAERYRPDLVLIPIGGHFVMDPADAAHATREYLKPRFAIPMHYGTFPPLKGTPEEYREALGETGTKVLTLAPGETVQF
jgi:L-ascorbate metabolism protein UlaG (beta-lactamase superfamily)